MTTETDHCEEFEIAALRRTRSALDARDADRLEAHLRGCAACRRFATTAEATGAALRGRVRTAETDRDWDDVRSAFRARRRRTRLAAAAAWALTPPLVALFWWTLPPLVSGVVTACLVVGLVAASRGGAAEAARARLAESVDHDLLAFYRADLDREIAVLRGSRPLFPLLSISFGVMIVVTLALLARSVLVDGTFDPKFLMPLTVLPAVYGWLWRRARIVLPRLERERGELA